MAVAAFIVSIVAVSISLGSYLLNRRAVAREERDRREQLDLLREQLRSEESGRRAQRRAGISVRQGGISGMPDNRAEYELFLTGLGPAPAVDVAVWMADRDTGEAISNRANTSPLPLATEVAVLLRAPRWSHADSPPYLMLEWTDGEGTRVEAARIQLQSL